MITTSTYSLLSVRRDGQTGSLSSGGGGGGGGGSSSVSTGGNGGSGTTYFAGTNLNLSGSTFNVIDSPNFAGNVSALKFIEGGTCLGLKFLPINNPIATGTLCAPIACFTTCSTTPIACATTCSTTPVSIATTCSTSPLLCATNITLACNEGSASFSSGFAGAGWLIQNNSGSYDLTVDNLVVRKMLKAYELQISKLSAVNGGMIISSANAKTTTFTGTSISIDTNSGHNPIQFVANDYVRAQKYDNGSLYFQGIVTGVYTNYITVTVLTGSIYANMDLVQVGNSTDTTRQSIIYLTASDTNNPYIDMLAGVNDGNFAGKAVVRLVNLCGITSSDLGSLSGDGLFSSNVYLTGKVVLPNAGITNDGNLASSVRFYAGDTYANRDTAVFRVTQDGSLTAKGIVEFGTKADMSGANVSVSGPYIWENSFNGNGSGIYINMVGYNFGVTKFRNTYIGDGKGTAMITTCGQLYTTYICGGLNVDHAICAPDFILTSDENLKTNIQSLSIAPINVDYKQFYLKSEPDNIRYGVIAQDLQEKYPELVHKGCDGMLGVSYTDLLIREVASLKCEVKQLKLDFNYYRNSDYRNNN
jgi:hypothetical protein